ncbi:hypothetical protein ACSVDA_24595 [Cytobacillus sp. Hm23]
MKCYYCEKDSEGLAFQQGDFLCFAHQECAVEKVKSDGNLIKGLVNPNKVRERL